MNVSTIFLAKFAFFAKITVVNQKIMSYLDISISIRGNKYVCNRGIIMIKRQKEEVESWTRNHEQEE